jgi:imidazolonepropionase-like amidohydrolase
MQSYFDLLKRNNTILDATLSAYSDDQSGEQDITKFTHEVTKSAHLRGVEIGAGSDNFNESVTSNNFLLLNEIKLIKEITGMSEMNALKTATINNAKSIGIDDEYGTIEIGKKADLIILNDNPLENLDNLKSIELVIKDGFEHNL